MLLPGALKTSIHNSEAVLVLGAGSSVEATDNLGNHPPSGAQLSKLLADEFLDGQFADYPLTQVGEYAISEQDLVTVQKFISDLLLSFHPSPSHRLLPTFNWHGIATTNYDVLVEAAYSAASTNQILVPFIENSDRVTEQLQTSNAIAYLKLHGCATRCTAASCPLILTSDQYVDYMAGREHVFNMLIDWARERPLIFIGHRIDDMSFRDILKSLDRQVPSRPRYYMVTPSPSPIVIRYWEKRRIRVLEGTFADFISSI